MEVIALFFGILFAYTAAWLILFFPILGWWLGCSPVRVVCFFMLGCLLTKAHQVFTETPVALPVQFGAKVILMGEVSSIPKIDGVKIRFPFKVMRLNRQSTKIQVWMTCYSDCPQVKVGETWQIGTRLFSPVQSYGDSNTGFQNWMRSNHLHYLGRFKKRDARRLKPANMTWIIQTLRSHLAHLMQHHLATDDALGIIQGLTVGIGQHISRKQWELFQRTGTVHLVVISGEHISLIAGSLFYGVTFLWKRLGTCSLYIPSQQVGGIIAWLLGWFYALLAGWGAPVERAFVGFGLVLLKYFIYRSFTVWEIWRYALLIVILSEPHVVLTPGFYLSFVAVAILLLIHQRFPQRHPVISLLNLQFFCLLGLLPLTLFFFSYGALNGFIVNLIVIPLVGWIIVPSALIGLLLLGIFHWAGGLWVAKTATHLLLKILSFFDGTAWINLQDVHLDEKGLVVSSLTLLLMLVLPLRKLFPVYGLLFISGIMP